MSQGVIASFGTPSSSLSTELLQGLTNRRGAQPTVLAQLLYGDGLLELAQSLEDALLRGEGRRGILL